jgi:hypothetical protein
MGRIFPWRRLQQKKEAVVDLSPEELRKRYKESSF